MKSLIIIVSGVLISFSVSAADVSMAVPGAKDAAGRSVLTFIAKDPPGQRCNGNLQVAAEIANTYRVPIQSTTSVQPGAGTPRARSVLRYAVDCRRQEGFQRCRQLPDHRRCAGYGKRV